MRRLCWTLAFVAVCSSAVADVKPLPRDQWPKTAAEAVPLILAAMNPGQRSIVAGTSQDNVFMLEGEWGEDIETLLGLQAGNRALAPAVCGRPCPVNEATRRLMEAAWEVLAK